MAKYGKIEVEIEGEGEGLLFHSAESMVDVPVTTKNPTKHYDPIEEAEKVVYRNEEGLIYIPSRCIKACILNASAWVKFGKKSAKPIIAGTTRIEPYEVVLTDKKGKKIKDYKVDRRPVNVQRQKIIRSRPLVKDWKAKFEIIYNADLLDPESLRPIIEESGQRVGLLDNRPQKYGENGLFKVNKFLPKGE